MSDYIYKYIDTMKTIKTPAQSEINIKKSQFICGLYPTKNKAESKEIIQRLNQKYSDATHNCTAYIVGDGEGFDDDGEPGGTAGKPMINVLRKNELHNVTAVVTRYFGGIKLGAGGLVRAYSSSAKMAVEAAGICSVCSVCRLSVRIEYTFLDRIIKMAAEDLSRPESFVIAETDYGEKVTLQLLCQEEDEEKVSGMLANLTSGTAQIIERSRELQRV